MTEDKPRNEALQMNTPEVETTGVKDLYSQHLRDSAESVGNLKKV
jgi:hypothetical protein